MPERLMKRIDSEKAVVWGGSYHGRMLDVGGSPPMCIEMSANGEHVEQYVRVLVTLEDHSWIQQSYMYAPVGVDAEDVARSTRHVCQDADEMHCNGVMNAMRVAMAMNEEWLSISLRLMKEHKKIASPTPRARHCMASDLRREQGFVKHLMEKLNHDPNAAYRVSLSEVKVTTILE